LVLVISKLTDIQAVRICVKNMEYTGERNTTITGKQCISWEKLNRKTSLFSTADLDTSFNYCRDPSNLGFNWCYVAVSKDTEQWEPCLTEGDFNWDSSIT
jgi:hypothetical protein